MAVFTEKLKPLATKVKEDPYWEGERASVAYVDNIEDISAVVPIWMKLINAGIIYPRFTFLGPFAVVWVGYKVVIIEEDGTAYFLTKEGTWETKRV